MTRAFNQTTARTLLAAWIAGVALLTAQTAFAQAPEPDPPKPYPEPQPEPQPAPVPEPVQPAQPVQPAPAPRPVAQPAPQPRPSTTTSTPAPTPSELQSAPFTRENTFGIGPALVFWPPQKDDPNDVWDIAGGFSLQHRKAKRFGSSFVGYEWTNDIVFHDFKAMGDAYGWYFDKPDPSETPEGEDPDDLRAMRITLLWPGLLLIPFGAANYTTGFGLVFWFSNNVPAIYFDAGFNANIWLRLSDPDFRADFGFGLYGGVGADIAKNLGVNVRVSWGTPFIHTLIRNTQGGITTALLNLNFAH